MAGGQYVALSGMRTRLDELDRLASDIANVGTAGYKSERISQRDSPRPRFEAVLETTIDATSGSRRLDTRAGAMAPTGRSLDIAIEGSGFLVVDTPGGARYTRNGHLSRADDGTLTTSDGLAVRGVDGPIRLGDGPVKIDADGTVTTGDAVVGKLAVVEFADPGALTRQSSSLLVAPEGVEATPSELSRVRVGSLEQSNVSMVDRVAQLTTVSRNFQALQKALSVLINDIDGRVVESLGRR